MELTIHQRKIEGLKLADYNPRQMSSKMKQELVTSIKEFGLVDPLVVNMAEGRENIIVGGHQRAVVIKESFPEMLEIPCVYVYLAEDKERELNLRLNKNIGEWDLEKLLANFELDLLKNIGFEDYELDLNDKNEDDLQKAARKHTNDNVPYPIVPKYTERYDAVIIFSDNALDYTWLKNVLELKKAKDYKNERTGVTQVMTVKQFQDVWESKIADSTESFKSAEDKDAGAGKETVMSDDDE